MSCHRCCKRKSRAAYADATGRNENFQVFGVEGTPIQFDEIGPAENVSLLNGELLVEKDGVYQVSFQLFAKRTVGECQSVALSGFLTDGFFQAGGIASLLPCRTGSGSGMRIVSIKKGTLLGAVIQANRLEDEGIYSVDIFATVERIADLPCQ